ncbi:ProQ/FinO family protein [Actimicrobium antarcticum]|uniref:ProQ/FinO domain-containing protein n=1 Tax=Actimicrobium antarcticum TaxID=1051899 RepID=A0ABP7SPU7_9BURK
MTSPTPAPAPAPAPAPNPVQAARVLLKELQQTFPAFRDCLPLAIGIDKQLIARQPELPRKILRIALGQHTNSLRYLKSVEKASNRFDLDGQPGEALTDEHRLRASTLLKERFKKEADQRKAARAKEEEARLSAEADRLHAEKLSMLAAKFAK